MNLFDFFSGKCFELYEVYSKTVLDLFEVFLELFWIILRSFWDLFPSFEVFLFTVLDLSRPFWELFRSFQCLYENCSGSLRPMFQVLLRTPQGKTYCQGMDRRYMVHITLIIKLSLFALILIP